MVCFGYAIVNTLHTGNNNNNNNNNTPKAEEGYCNEATQSGPLTHIQSHQAQNTVEHTEGFGQKRK